MNNAVLFGRLRFDENLATLMLRRALAVDGEGARVELFRLRRGLRDERAALSVPVEKLARRERLVRESHGLPPNQTASRERAALRVVLMSASGLNGSHSA